MRCEPNPISMLLVMLTMSPALSTITKCVVAEIGKLKLSKPTKSQVQIDQAINLMPNN